MTQVYDILSDLGIGRRYIGRNYLAYSIQITMHDENYFFAVTKHLYPDVAKHFGTTWKCVERDMRTAISACWKTNRAHLEKLARHPLWEVPRAVDFIDIIVTHLLRQGGAQHRREPAERPGGEQALVNPPAQAPPAAGAYVRGGKTP